MTPPEMTPVDSSNIEALGFDEDAQELYVQFDSGRTYIYSNVSIYTYEDLMAAPSKGSYFNREIKPNFEARLG